MGTELYQAVRDVVTGAGVVYAGLMIASAVAFLAQVTAARYLSVSSFGSATATGTVPDGA